LKANVYLTPEYTLVFTKLFMTFLPSLFGYGYPSNQNLTLKVLFTLR
jgi:hypothetical protein